jgi:hypothetical protein
MTLTISNIIYDESGISDADGDTDNTVSSLSTALTSQIGALSLGGQLYTGANAVAQYAELTNVVTSTNNPVTNYALASDSSGDALSTTGAGVATGLFVGTNEIFLYGTSDPNVVVGRIGTGNTGDSSGAIAMILALNETKDGSGHVTGTDLGVAMFAPLVNSNGSAVDDGDVLTMANGSIFLYSTYDNTMTVNFDNFGGVHSGEIDFAMVPASSGSATDDILISGFIDQATDTNAEVTVSTQGLGVGSQNIGQTNAIRIDFVTGGTVNSGKAPTAPAYTDHVNVDGANFEITQVNPTGKLVTFSIYAYTEGHTNVQGTSFYNSATSNEGAAVAISAANVHIYNGVVGVSGTSDVTAAFLAGGGKIIQDPNNASAVQIIGLPNNYSVGFTTVSAFDRMVVENTGSVKNLTFDVGPIHMTTVTGGVNHDVADLSPHLLFEDGGPSFGANGTVPTVTVDEHTLATPASTSFAGVFSPQGGPDGLAGTTYALGVVAGASGLVDTATGQNVILELVGGVVEGVTAVSNQEVFSVTVDSTGKVTLDQLRAVKQPLAGSGGAAYNESVTLSAANLVTLTATATDGDGDTATSTANIGTSLIFKDAGPGVTANGTVPTLTVDEHTLATPASTSFAGVFTPVADADGITGTAYALGVVAGPSGLVDTVSGQNVVLELVGGVVEGVTAVSSLEVFSVTVDSTGKVTLDQFRAVEQPLAGSGGAAYNEPVTLSAANLVTLTATVTDGDGDTAAATANIGQNLVFKDAGPGVTATGTIPTLTVDEHTLATPASASFAGVFTPVADPDGITGTAYALGVVAGPSGLVDTATGQNVILELVGGVVEGVTSGSNDEVFSVTVDSTGKVTLDQFRAVVQPLAGSNPAVDYNEPVTLSAANLVTLTATVTDGDGDTASATANIAQNLVFKDAAPTITAPGTIPTVTVSEVTLGLAGAQSGDFSGVFHPVYGADGPAASAPLTYALGVSSA